MVTPNEIEEIIESIVNSDFYKDIKIWREHQRVYAIKKNSRTGVFMKIEEEWSKSKTTEEIMYLVMNLCGLY